MEIMRFRVKDVPEGNHVSKSTCAPNLFFYLNYEPKTNDLSISIEINDGWKVYGNLIQKFKGNIFNFKTGEVYYNFSSENLWEKYYNERKQELANRMSNGIPYSSVEVENFEHICRKDYESICEKRICGKDYNDKVLPSLVSED